MKILRAPSAVWTRSTDSIDLGIKWYEYTHIQPNFVTDTL